MGKRGRRKTLSRVVFLFSKQAHVNMAVTISAAYVFFLEGVGI